MALKSPPQPATHGAPSMLLVVCACVKDDKQSSDTDYWLASLTAFPEALMKPPMNPPKLKATRSGLIELDAKVQVPSPLSEAMRQKVQDWNFNIHEIPMSELPELCFGKAAYSLATAREAARG